MEGITKKHCVEFGQVSTLVSIIFILYFKNNNYAIAAFVLLLITIVAPIILYPFAFLWFALSELLSKVSPVIILGVLFFLIVVPVGLLRKLFGKDSLRLKQFKKDKTSLLIERNHSYTDSDLLHTF
jgi:polyferredoxin